MNQTNIDAGRFDVAKIAAALPETATALLVAGFEDEDEYEAPGEGGPLTDVTQG
jgi:hypothetical protein